MTAYLYGKLKQMAESRGKSIPPPQPALMLDAFFRADVELWLDLDRFETEMMLALDAGVIGRRPLTRPKDAEIWGEVIR